MHINFLQHRINTQVVTVLTSLFAIKSQVEKFATTNKNFRKSALSNMHHRRTYMLMNFQQHQVSR